MFSLKQKATAAALAIAATALLAFSAATTPTAQAMGSATPAPKPCAKLKWGSQKWKRCRRRNGLPTQTSAEAEEALVLGYALAKDGRYEEALRRLKAFETVQDPRVLTYIGFAERKLGRVAQAMTYYAKALEIDPMNVATLEYQGEAHLQKGDVAAAKSNLAQIEGICGTDCDAYQVLAKAIADHPNATQPDVSKLERAS